jgi:hypothetical protein
MEPLSLGATPRYKYMVSAIYSTNADMHRNCKHNKGLGLVLVGRLMTTVVWALKRAVTDFCRVRVLMRRTAAAWTLRSAVCRVWWESPHKIYR